ncbi:hypothetical protein K440DRAFT_661082 [Wilcoxina mikolae CBS 423.85]|nr:hypothetical protein K440DRAFT_661082 [Wilcoxina mikolae CBS 423.85]
MSSNNRNTHPLFRHITKTIVSNVEFSSSADKEKAFNAVQAGFDKTVNSLSDKIRNDRASTVAEDTGSEMNDDSVGSSSTNNKVVGKSTVKPINKPITVSNSGKKDHSKVDHSNKTSKGIENTIKILKDLDKEAKIMARPTFKHSRKTSDGMIKSLKFLNELNAEQALAKKTAKPKAFVPSDVINITGGAEKKTGTTAVHDKWVSAKTQLPGLKTLRLGLDIPPHLAWFADPNQCMLRFGGVRMVPVEKRFLEYNDPITGMVIRRVPVC